MMKKTPKKKHPNLHLKSILGKKHPKKTPIFKYLPKKHPYKNTNFENSRKKHQQTKHQFLKKAKKTPQKNTQKKHLPDYHWGGVQE